MGVKKILQGKKKEREMERYTRKSRRIVDAAVEVTQVIGVRTRARTLALAVRATEQAVVGGRRTKKRKTSEDEAVAERSELGVMQMAYLQLRNRSLVMTQRLSEPGRNLAGKRRKSVDRDRISRCSSISSCEAVGEDDAFRFPTAGDQKPCVDLCSLGCYFYCNRDRREATPSCNDLIYSGEMESTAERKSCWQSSPKIRMPSASEIEEFFAAAEKAEKQRFASKYNFDVDLEAPSEGRYEWARINP